MKPFHVAPKGYLWNEISQRIGAKVHIWKLLLGKSRRDAIIIEKKLYLSSKIPKG